MDIRVNEDYELDLATAHSRMSKKWRNRKWRWSELIARCSETLRTGETAAEYARMSREERSQVKDVGGFVGGYLSGGIRKTTNVLYRSVATLDIDYGTSEVWDDFKMAYRFAAMMYSTHSHSAASPRYRLVFPLSRAVASDEYEPLCRRIADTVGIDLFDETTYDLPRLFYWPSSSKDAPYEFHYQDGPACDVDKVLSQYVDYRDVSSWPLSSREGDAVAHQMRKAGDPTDKPGVIGAFCRAYSIEQAIEKFLGDRYEATGQPGRYTYRMGSVAGGLVCYQGLYAYSHHETDPAGRRLCNAFDLCRIHLYGGLDDGSRAQDVTRLPSYTAMMEMAAADKDVRLMMAKERDRKAAEEFAGLDGEKEDDSWKTELEYTRTGRLINSISNIILILEHDRSMSGRIARDLFTGTDAAVGPLPWKPQPGQWTDSDDANLRVWLEKTYGITGKDKISDALTAVLTRHSYHPIRDYLDGLKWDGRPRLDRIIIDYIGAEDSGLNRDMSRKHFTAAVARVFEPGCKYDYCLIMSGAEGIGKSTLLSIMGGRWFNDSITTTEGKEGMEQLRRAWIIELSELSSIKRSDVEQVKAYLSKQVDIYRVAYGRRVTEHPRQCVFCGTTNEDLFLKGDNGNRRFWVIPVDARLRKYDDWREALIRDRDQLWAEAVHYYRKGERLYLTGELEEQAKQRQQEFNDGNDDPLASLIDTYLDTLLPANWDTMDLQSRRQYLRNPDPLQAVGVVMRTRVCAAEFICEMLGRDMADKEYKYLARRVCRIIGDMPGWEKISTTRHAEQLYGRQKGFKRVQAEEIKKINDNI